MKLDILMENKNKSGIYRWVNNENGKSYIGSAVDITRRLRNYYNAERLIKENNVVVSKAISEHRYASSRLEILECTAKGVIKRFYWRENSIILICSLLNIILILQQVHDWELNILLKLEKV
jgi:group I intron endonuclease